MIRSVLAVAFLATVVLVPHTALAQAPVAEQPHRSDFVMNFVGGGDFRSWVSEVVEEDTRWAHSLRTLGVLHNHMHELMSDLAAHHRDEAGGEDLVPAFENRISGGDWTEYRRAIESSSDAGVAASGDARLRHALVQVTEIMHDRVHHAMFKALVRDDLLHDRDAELAEFLRDGRAYEFEDTVPQEGRTRNEWISQDDFRELEWATSVEGPRLHAAFQKMVVFDYLLYDLMEQWARVGAEMDEAACRPPEYGPRISGHAWHEYRDRVSDCSDASWRELVVVTALMHDRIHHMMARMAALVEARHPVEEAAPESD
ncbi:MAG: hypothetical protein EA352_00505 [Gemmatimonadales bacterium]|nr:MAG: hypothetical protein EA352_00505 [Gemmatimonadales bacterium]